MKVLSQENWSWTLYKDNCEYYLSVVCGSVGVFEKIIVLSEDEIDKFNKYGKVFINEISQAIRDSEESFKERIKSGKSAEKAIIKFKSGNS